MRFEIIRSKEHCDVYYSWPKDKDALIYAIEKKIFWNDATDKIVFLNGKIVKQEMIKNVA